jgi:hypothetical protein
MHKYIYIEEKLSSIIDEGKIRRENLKWPSRPSMVVTPVIPATWVVYIQKLVVQARPSTKVGKST